MSLTFNDFYDIDKSYNLIEDIKKYKEVNTQGQDIINTCKQNAFLNSSSFFFIKDNKCYLPIINDCSLCNYNDRHSKINNHINDFLNNNIPSDSGNSQLYKYNTQITNKKSPPQKMFPTSLRISYNNLQQDFKTLKQMTDITDITIIAENIVNKIYTKTSNAGYDNSTYMRDLSMYLIKIETEINNIEQYPQIFQDISNLIEFKNAYFNEIKILDNIIKEKEFELQQIIQFNGANNGRLVDIRLIKSMIISETAILSIVLIITMLYIKLKK
jgi:hypothetical protein